MVKYIKGGPCRFEAGARSGPPAGVPLVHLPLAAAPCPPTANHKPLSRPSGSRSLRSQNGIHVPEPALLPLIWLKKPRLEEVSYEAPSSHAACGDAGFSSPILLLSKILSSHPTLHGLRAALFYNRDFENHRRLCARPWGGCREQSGPRPCPPGGRTSPQGFL